MRVGLVEVGDVFAGEVGGQALLPEEVRAFDFAFGLWGSHGAYSLYEPQEMMEENKNYFRKILHDFINRYPFNPALFPPAAAPAAPAPAPIPAAEPAPVAERAPAPPPEPAPAQTS